MKVLILGGNGFLGINLIKKIISFAKAAIVVFDEYNDKLVKTGLIYNKKIRYVKGLFTARYDFEKLTEKMDIVIHLISTVSVQNSNINTAKDLVDNVAVTAILCDCCVKNKIKKFIFASSGGTVYGASAAIPIKEEAVTNPISAYGLQKLSIEKMLYMYKYLYGLDYCIVRIANLYGPHQRPNGMVGLVNTLIYNTINDKKMYIYGDGNIIRDYIFVEDAVKQIAELIINNCKYNIYNVGTGAGHSINEVRALVEKILRKKANCIYLENRKNDVPVCVLDNSRFCEEFGYTELVDLKKGIEITKKYLENINE